MAERHLYVWSTKLGEKGQIVIPKQAREVFNLQTGDTIMLLGDTTKGIALARQQDLVKFATAVFDAKDNEND